MHDVDTLVKLATAAEHLSYRILHRLQSITERLEDSSDHTEHRLNYGGCSLKAYNDICKDQTAYGHKYRLDIVVDRRERVADTVGCFAKDRTEHFDERFTDRAHAVKQ